MTLQAPQTRYARSGDLYIAYQVVGDGPIDIVFLSEWWIPLDARWDEPEVARPLHRLASFGRLISFDRRGTGGSDPVPSEDGFASEELINDILTVMDAVGSERAAVVALSDSGAAAMLFAATYPQRTTALVLVNTMARLMQDADYPWGMPPKAHDRLLEGVVEDWTLGTTFAKAVPVVARDPRLRQWLLRARRSQASPGVGRAIYRSFRSLDVRHVLSTIQAPTLVVHRAGCHVIRAAHGRYLAENIPGAKYVELPGEEMVLLAGDGEAVVDEIEEFLTGVRPVPETDRVLATVLFTDIVRSTERAAALGDRRWRELLDRHDEEVRRELERFRGREVKVAGDGFLATFDGPARAIRCACAITDVVRDLGLEVRAGLHSGEVEIRGEDIAGVAVHIGARVAALAGPGEVLVSGAVPPLVAGSGLEFADRGIRELKGVPGEWKIFAVVR